MGLKYAIPIAATAVTAQVDFWEYTAPADAIAIIHYIEITQSTEVGDAMEEGLVVLLKRGSTTTGTGGSQAVTPAPLEFGFPAAGGVADTLNTTKATGGTIVTLHSAAWNVRAPFIYLPTPEYRIVLSPSQRFTVELGTTPADSITVQGTLIFEEIGG
jgi:hypothetical protein